MIRKPKVFVGLSGGVDSAVSAALLKKAGHEVIGVFIKVWSPEWLSCTWPEERRDAMRVAAHLDIPFITLDLGKEYKKEVADYMIAEYEVGRTPNSDVMCNKEIKFGAFYDWAMRQGADFVATGHYAQIQKVEGSRLKVFGNMATPLNLKPITYNLLAGADREKDQSYFLWNLKQEQLSHILFPVGNKTKEEVRRLAKKFKIPVAEKKDSQGICFLGKLDMKEFLKHYIESKPGNVLNENGEVIGRHEGSVFYTIGEHHIGYVITKDLKKNTITVSKNRLEEVLDSKECILKDVNWLADEPDFSPKYFARVRYRQELQKVKLEAKSQSLVAIFDRPQILTPGQSVVIYSKEICLGGGVISGIY